jgi:hypothetical protein
MVRAIRPKTKHDNEQKASNDNYLCEQSMGVASLVNTIKSKYARDRQTSIIAPKASSSKGSRNGWRTPHRHEHTLLKRTRTRCLWKGLGKEIRK